MAATLAVLAACCGASVATPGRLARPRRRDANLLAGLRDAGLPPARAAVRLTALPQACQTAPAMDKLENLESHATRDFLAGDYDAPVGARLPESTCRAGSAIASSAKLAAYDLLNAKTRPSPSGSRSPWSSRRMCTRPRRTLRQPRNSPPRP